MGTGRGRNTSRQAAKLNLVLSTGSPAGSSQAAAAVASTSAGSALGLQRQLPQEQPNEAVDASPLDLRWGRESIPVAAAAAAGAAAAAAVHCFLDMAFAAILTASQVLHALIQRCVSGDIISTCAQWFATTVRQSVGHRQAEGALHQNLGEERTRQRQQHQPRQQQTQQQQEQVPPECPLCGELLAARLLAQHLEGELQHIADLEQQHWQQQHQP